MGMDYRYAGSASYPRFNKEMEKVAKLFGAIDSKELKENKEKYKDGINWVDHMFGKEHDVDIRYVFPKDTPEVLVKFFNHPYDDLTVEETKEVHDLLEPKREQIEEIANQIMYELDDLVLYEESWSIC